MGEKRAISPDRLDAIESRRRRLGAARTKDVKQANDALQHVQLVVHELRLGD